MLTPRVTHHHVYQSAVSQGGGSIEATEAAKPSPYTEALAAPRYLALIAQPPIAAGLQAKLRAFEENLLAQAQEDSVLIAKYTETAKESEEAVNYNALLFHFGRPSFAQNRISLATEKAFEAIRIEKLKKSVEAMKGLSFLSLDTERPKNCMPIQILA
jgi:hypothetical protein